ncbi:hypothetical protein FACS1894218_1950 [Bacilli bacterium]|nr:hypothetical protein FACS1894218_1950 [Bacilli bacterium]
MATNIHVSIPFDQQYIDSNSSMLLGYNKDYHINNSLNLTSEYAKIARAN